VVKESEHSNGRHSATCESARLERLCASDTTSTEREQDMHEQLASLVAKARQTEMNSKQVREQRQSFVYGNTHIENSLITKTMVVEADRKIEKEKLMND
jgi:hypothetical protein